MKLAQTRLENRTYRPNVELCRDAPQYGLTDEVKQLEATKRALEEKCKQAKYVFFFLFNIALAFILAYKMNLNCRIAHVNTVINT